MTAHDGTSLRVDEIEEAVRGSVPAGEFLVHYEVIVQTRTGPDASEIVTRRVSMPGCDPHLSLGVLTVQAALLSRTLLTTEDSAQ